MFMKALLLPIMGPIDGVVWIAKKIEERANTEFNDQENLHKQLLTLQLSFDIGEITEEEYEAQEEEILLRIQALEEQARLEAESEAQEEEAFEEESQETTQVVGYEALEEVYQSTTEYEQEENQNLILLP